MFSLLFLCVLIAKEVSAIPARTSGPIEEESGYVTVRPKAHLFWWLYHYSGTEDWKTKPLIMWLQGGPGAPSSGYGNIHEVGPLDLHLKEREYTWIKKANILFVDQPVGAGYSYIEPLGKFTTNNTEIAWDLVNLTVNFFESHPYFKTVPFYIFGESYGGKMAVTYALELLKTNKTKVDLKGIAFIDSWISPMDYVLSWAPYLYHFSLIDEASVAAINSAAEKCKRAFEKGLYVQATEEWYNTEMVILEHTNNVNFYNVLMEDPYSAFYRSNRMSDLAIRPKGPVLSSLMNGYFREKLNIPSNVVWDSQSGKVFNTLSGDFMKPVINEVDELLNKTSVEIIVINGQLDLIVDTVGTNWWIQKLKWQGLSSFNKTSRIPFGTSHERTAGFVKSYGKLSMYYMLKSGHMVPGDTPESAFKMLDMILNRNHKP